MFIDKKMHSFFSQITNKKHCLQLDAIHTIWWSEKVLFLFTMYCWKKIISNKTIYVFLLRLSWLVGKLFSTIKWVDCIYLMDLRKKQCLLTSGTYFFRFMKLTVRITAFVNRLSSLKIRNSMTYISQ